MRPGFPAPCPAHCPDLTRHPRCRCLQRMGHFRGDASSCDRPKEHPHVCWFQGAGDCAGSLTPSSPPGALPASSWKNWNQTDQPDQAQHCTSLAGDSSWATPAQSRELCPCRRHLRPPHPTPGYCTLLSGRKMEPGACSRGHRCQAEPRACPDPELCG